MIAELVVVDVVTAVAVVSVVAAGVEVGAARWVEAVLSKNFARVVTSDAS